MKQILSILLSLLLALSLSACGGEAPTNQVASEPVTSESSVDSSTAQSSEPPSTEEDIPEEPLPLEEEEVEEEVTEPPAMINGENSVSVVVGEETVAEFTLPTETPIYDELKYMDDGQMAMMTHNVMAGVSGRTIVEAFDGTAEGYLDFYKSITFGNEDADAQTSTRDVNGKEALVCKAETIDETDGHMTRDYVIAVPVTENAVLGFRINSVSSPRYDVQFDDSIIDILLSHCAF